MDSFAYKKSRQALAFILATVPQLVYSETVSEYSIKTAFIYNFARFTEWPERSDILKVCIYGKDPFNKKIDKIDGKKANNRTIKVVRTRSLEEVKTCDIAFLNIIPPERRLFERVLKTLKGAHVLTISDADDVVDFGVMIGLTVDDNDNVRFDINLFQANQEKIKISSKIIDLAGKVNK